jgi:hypothetical protein
MINKIIFLSYLLWMRFAGLFCDAAGILLDK